MSEQPADCSTKDADQPTNDTGSIVATSSVAMPRGMTVDLIVTVLANRHEIPGVVPTALTQRNVMMGVENHTVGASVWTALTTALLARVVVPLVNRPPPGVPVRGILPVVGVWVVPSSADFRTRSEHHFDTPDFDVFIHKVNQGNTVVRGQNRRKSTHQFDSTLYNTPYRSEPATHTAGDD